MVAFRELCQRGFLPRLVRGREDEVALPYRHAGLARYDVGDLQLHRAVERYLTREYLETHVPAGAGGAGRNRGEILAVQVHAAVGAGLVQVRRRDGAAGGLVFESYVNLGLVAGVGSAVREAYGAVALGRGLVDAVLDDHAAGDASLPVAEVGVYRPNDVVAQALGVVYHLRDGHAAVDGIAGEDYGVDGAAGRVFDYEGLVPAACGAVGEGVLVDEAGRQVPAVGVDGLAGAGAVGEGAGREHERGEDEAEQTFLHVSSFLRHGRITPVQCSNSGRLRPGSAKRASSSLRRHKRIRRILWRRRQARAGI